MAPSVFPLIVEKELNNHKHVELPCKVFLAHHQTAQQNISTCAASHNFNHLFIVVGKGKDGTNKSIEKAQALH